MTHAERVIRMQSQAKAFKAAIGILVKEHYKQMQEDEASTGVDAHRLLADAGIEAINVCC